MNKINKQKLLSAIDEAITRLNEYYEATGLTKATCLVLGSELMVAFNNIEEESLYLESYRTATGARVGTAGFDDHPNFSEYSPKERQRVRIQKLEQFRDYVLNHWEE